MNLFKNSIINLSPYKYKYIDLILENCLHENNDDFYNNKILRDALFNVIIYGNVNSRCRKKLSLHTRLNTIDEIEKHQIANEFEKFQRVRFYFHWILLACLISIIIQYMLF